MRKTVHSEMSNELVTIGHEAPLADAYRIMSKLEIRHLPVVDEKKEIVGIISSRDLQRAMTSRLTGRNGVKVESLSFHEDQIVGDYMTTPPQYVLSDSELKEVAEIMLNSKISALLVVEEGDVVGIITTDDMLRAVVHLLNESEDGGAKLGPFYSRGFLGRLAQMVSDAGI